MDELIPAIKSGTFPRIIASAMGLDPSKVKAREEGPVDPLLALTTAKLKGLKVPNTIPENLAAEDEAHERSTHVNAGALNASMAGSGSRFGSTVSRNIPIVGDAGRLAQSLGGGVDGDESLTYSAAASGASAAGGSIASGDVSRQLLKKKAEPRPNPVVFTCELLNYVDKPWSPATTPPCR